MISSKEKRNKFAMGEKMNEGIRAYFDPLTEEGLRNFTEEQFTDLFLGKEKYEHMWSGTNGKWWGHIKNAGREAAMNFIADLKAIPVPAEVFCDKGFDAPSGFGRVTIAELRSATITVFGDDFANDGIGELTAAPSSSIVLQRREGYRDILRKWLQSQAAAKISWAAGEEAFRENQKDVATLYEYWCFFRLLDIVKDAFGISEERIAKELVVDKGTDGLSLKINEGAQLPPLNGTFVSGHTSQRYRKLDIEFHYNRHFTNSSKGGKSSWTMTMIPDYTISFRPQGMDVELAEKLDLITYVHFDAKYKAKEIVEEMSAAELDADTATTEEVKSRKDVKRVDILKMHTYRDAIPRTAGAYILYPGTKDNSRRYEYGDEILPSLGAFPLYPRDDKSDEEPIGRFLTSVAEYLCDRITRWENFTYQKNLVFSGSQEEWGKKQAEVAHHVKTMGLAEDWQGGRESQSDRAGTARHDPRRSFPLRQHWRGKGDAVALASGEVDFRESEVRAI